MKQISILLAIVLTTTLANAAPPDTATANTIIRDFSREIYVMAERNGGSPAQWRAAQSKALAALRDVGNAHPEILIATDGKGRSPLMNAAIEGYHFMAAALLAHASVMPRCSWALSIDTPHHRDQRFPVRTGGRQGNAY
ncbi:MAG: hypothetical protein Q9M48_07780, partial [Rhodobacterales bacterium]|nr:hypothetical protein [Rhodobacterales bacterium]